MFEHEECYIGYIIRYYGDMYYVIEDDENTLSAYKINCDYSFSKKGIYTNGINYVFDFNRIYKIRKQNKFEILYTYGFIAYEDVLKLKDKVFHKKNEEETNLSYKYKFGDVLSKKKPNKKIVFIHQIGKYIYYCDLESIEYMYGIYKTKESKIQGKVDSLDEENINKLLFNFELYFKLSSSKYVDERIIKSVSEKTKKLSS